MLPLEDRDDMRDFARMIHGANGGTPYSGAQALLREGKVSRINYPRDYSDAFFGSLQD